MTERSPACEHGKTDYCDACSNARSYEIAGLRVEIDRLRAERDALQRKYDYAVGAECAGTIVKGEGYVPACRTLRAERDKALGALKEIDAGRVREAATASAVITDMREKLIAMERERDAARAALKDEREIHTDAEQGHIQEIDKLRAELARTLTLTPEEIEALVEFSGAGTDDGCEITIGWLDQHEGNAGWYAWLAEYPEEGSVAVKLPCDDHNAGAAIDAALREGGR